MTRSPGEPTKPPRRRRNAWLINALLIIGSTALSLAVAEMVLRFQIKPRAVMTRQILSQLAVTDSDQNWERHPELGWMIKSNATFWHTSPFGEFDQEIRTGEQGLRVPLKPDEQGARAARTILFIGDSATAAYEVPYEQTYVAKVEATLKAAGQSVRAINAGIRGYSTEQSYKRMLSLLERNELGVTDVVYLFSLNDPFENMSLHFPVRLMSKPGAYLDQDGQLKFRALDYPVGVLDPEALFVTPDGGIGTLPVVGRNSLSEWVVTRTLRYKEARDWFDSLYVVGLAKLAIQLYAAPRDAEAIRTRYPYIRAEYVASGFGGYMPGFIDVSWEPGSYPLRLLEAIIRSMKAAAERRGVRFWVALPLTAAPESLAFFRELATKYGIAVIDPVSDGLRDRWAAKCGGRVVFDNDGHLTACGHTGQAEPIAAALQAAQHLH